MLSVVITAWNEETNLPRAVASVKGLADEIVVVDTESTDKTVAVARELGCTVYHHANTRIVEPVRNFSISKAKGDWILLLDADEEVSADFATEVKKIIALGKYDYCRLPRQNLIFGKWVKSSHWWPDYVYRLFKKGAIVWQETIHSIPLTEGVGYDFPAEEKFSLIHHNYDSISQYLTRLNRYTDIQSESLLASSYTFSWSDLVVKPANEFLNQYFSRRGYAEGIHGLALALLQSVSELVVYLKVWQSSGYPGSHPTPPQQNAVFMKIGRDFLWWNYQSEIDRSQSRLHQLILKSKRWFLHLVGFI